MKYDKHSTNTTVMRYGRKAVSLITVVLLCGAQVAEVAGNIVFIHHLLLLFREIWELLVLVLQIAIVAAATPPPLLQDFNCHIISLDAQVPA